MVERSRCIQKINTILNNLKISEKIEESIYNFTIKQSKMKGIDENINDKFFKRIYVNKILSIYNNLDRKSYVKNDTFLNRVLNGEINPYEIAFLSPQEMNIEHWKQYIDRQSANDDFLYSRTAGIRTQEYKCGRCKERNCTYYQLQVRCSDEPMTTFVNCLNCGNRWSFN